MPTPLHRHLIADQAAQSAYRRALREAIQPGDVVLDLGTGTGIHAIFAAEAGARRVYALEQGPIAELAKRVIAANGWNERIRVIRGDAGEIELPEPVDAIVTHMWIFDLVNLLPRIRKRFLKPNGRTVPSRFDLHAALFTSPEAHRATVGMWDDRPFDLDFGAAAEEALRRTHAERFVPEQLVTEEHRVASFDLEGPCEPWFRAAITTRAKRPGEIHGLSFSLEQWLAGDVTISTRPPTTLPKAIWPQFVLPLRTPVSVAAGDSLALEMRFRLDPTGFVGEWTISARGEKAAAQLALAATSLASPRLREPPLRLSAAGEARRFVLDACDGSFTASAIAERLRSAFPDRFESARAAETFVAEVTQTLVIDD